MKLTKIMFVFIIIFMIVFSGYQVYSHNQEAIISQSNTNKANALNSAKSWRTSSNDNAILSINILLIHSQMIIYEKSDPTTFNKLKGYYKEIAEYLHTTENHLDEICAMGSEDSEKEIVSLLRTK